MIRTSRDHYIVALRKKVILEYIRENGRSPTRAEIIDLMRSARSKYPDIDNLGFSGYDMTVPSFRDISSSSAHNENNLNVRRDILVVNDKVSEISELIEDHFRAFKATVDKSHKLNSSLEARLNNLLLLSGRTDVFVAGVEETFDTNENIDQELSDIQYNPGYVTLGREVFIPKVIEDVKFKVNVHAPNGKISVHQKSSPRNLLWDDGSDWTLFVHTSYSKGPVYANLEMDLTPVNLDGIYVGDLRLTGDPLEVNGKLACSVYYSLNGWDYTLVDPSGLRFDKGENLICIGKENVKKIKIVLVKDAADMPDGNKHVYAFSLDSIEVLTGSYTVKQVSTLYAGPYELYDHTGEAVNFSMATMSHGTCCVIPETTSVEFFISKDGISWFPASFQEGVLDVIHFATTSVHNDYFLNDNVYNPYMLISDPTQIVKLDLDIQYGKEACINAYIPEELSSRFVQSNVIVKRNLRQPGVDLYGAASGWFKDERNLRYTTTIYVDSFEGAVLNLGGTSAYINGKLKTGEIIIPKGYHTFSTDYTNWQEVEPGLSQVNLLEDKDKLYPFNHRYLIEGYSYSPEFQGEKLYNGIGTENFGEKLTYVTPEEFEERDGDLSIYTIEEYNGNKVFLVKIDSGDSSWVNEYVDVDYMLRVDDLNTVYVKAVLRTSDPTITPHINKFQVRVI